MIKKILLEILASRKNLTTYKTGLLQAKAYRILKQRTQQTLEPYGISSLDWALLGVLSEHGDGFKLIELASLLGVEASFATVMIDVLEKKKLVHRAQSLKDKRAKIITLSKKGHALVPVIEKDLRENMKDLLRGTSLPSIHGYMSVLNTIVRNAESSAT